VPVDHESVLDSDSILSLTYLPESLVVLGGGVIASEYASVFAALGVRVAMLDKGARLLGFLDPELTQRFERALQGMGGSFVPGAVVVEVEPTGLGAVRVTLDDGGVLESEKVLCALGRVANVELLDLPAAGLEVSPRGHLPVGPHGETAVPGVYAVGDVAGLPSLATSAAAKGDARRGTRSGWERTRAPGWCRRASTRIRSLRVSASTRRRRATSTGPCSWGGRRSRRPRAA
jgi:NAD(P) transhydrogenase